MEKLGQRGEGLIRDLRRRLHDCPEISGREKRTKQEIITFLRAHTALEIVDCDQWFYAAHRETGAEKPGIALRADYDAVETGPGIAAHLCGHDGHAAALCGLGLMIEGKTLGRSVFLLFQPAEEMGEGARLCCDIFRREKIGEIYGAHNLPGFAKGTFFTRIGTFACASCGLKLRFFGAPAHAAYPEDGISPAMAVARLLMGLPQGSGAGKDGETEFCTVVGVRMGEPSFGMAAARAQVWLTLRAQRDEALAELEGRILDRCAALADEYELRFDYEECDRFPATRNDDGCARKVLACLGGRQLQGPMRWSEDFGTYLAKCKGAFFGVGAGEKHAPLHTSGYEYPDELLAVTCEAFYRLVCCGR